MTRTCVAQVQVWRVQRTFHNHLMRHLHALMLCV